MDSKCPQCGSVDTGPSFTFDYDRDDSGRVIARNPFFACGGCGHTWQVEMVLVVAQPFDPDDDGDGGENVEYPDYQPYPHASFVQ